jgi:hypothetical protein
MKVTDYDKVWSTEWDDMKKYGPLARHWWRDVLVSASHGRMRWHEPAAFGHSCNYARGELTQKLERAQLRVVRMIEWGFPFYSPLCRDLMNVTGSRGTVGGFSAGQELIMQLVYAIFRLNSTRRGDELIVFAEPRSDRN